MQSRNSLFHLFRQLRPNHQIRNTAHAQKHRFSSNRAASTIKTTASTSSPAHHLPPFPTISLSIHRSLSSSRFLNNTSNPSAVPTSDSATASFPLSQQQQQQPQYQLTFTCKPCTHRSTHSISQHGYHKGTVLVACPSCKNRHVVSDHLKIFSDKRITLEDIMREKGELVRRGRVAPGESGEDVEFYPPDEGGEKAQS